MESPLQNDLSEYDARPQFINRTRNLYPDEKSAEEEIKNWLSSEFSSVVGYDAKNVKAEVLQDVLSRVFRKGNGPSSKAGFNRRQSC